MLGLFSPWPELCVAMWEIANLLYFFDTNTSHFLLRWEPDTVPTTALHWNYNLYWCPSNNLKHVVIESRKFKVKHKVQIMYKFTGKCKLAMQVLPYFIITHSFEIFLEIHSSTSVESLHPCVAYLINIHIIFLFNHIFSSFIYFAYFRTWNNSSLSHVACALS